MIHSSIKLLTAVGRYHHQPPPFNFRKTVRQLCDLHAAWPRPVILAHPSRSVIEQSIHGTRFCEGPTALMNGHTSGSSWSARQPSLRGRVRNLHFKTGIMQPDTSKYLDKVCICVALRPLSAEPPQLNSLNPLDGPTAFIAHQIVGLRELGRVDSHVFDV